MNPLDISIIIVNWNTRDILRDCLRSVYEQTRDIRYEVIVVDNASSDSSVEMVGTDFPQAILIENSENCGFAAANNQGISIARGRYVLLLNSDTIVLDEAIQRTLIFADQQTETAVVGCKVLNRDRTLQSTCFMFPSLLNLFLSATYLYKVFPRSRFFGREQMTWWDRNDERQVDVVTGCFMLVRQEAIQKVRMMDERYFMYTEETDWCYRFKKAGWRIMFTPSAEIIHYGGQTTKKMADKLHLQLYGSKLIFMKLHGNGLRFHCVRLLIALFFLLRVPYWLFISLFSRSKEKSAFRTAVTYLSGAWFCLAKWKKLLMNYEVVKHLL